VVIQTSYFLTLSARSGLSYHNQDLFVRESA